MSQESHIAALRDKHVELDLAIEKEERRPGANTLHINELKREKLRMKDEIARLTDGGKDP